MTPIWIFPVYPLLIIGPHAGQLAKHVKSDAAIDIIVVGSIIQMIGFMISFMVYSAYLYRLMTKNLPTNSTRPGMFISIGPSGFTVSGIISMAHILPNLVPNDFMIPNMGKFVANVSLVVANWLGFWLWGLALWFFLVSVGAHCRLASRGRMQFAMTWFSFVFPNTALATATFNVALALNGNRSVVIFGLIMSVGLILAWLFVVVMMIRAVYTRQVLWPQKQEDRDVDAQQD